MTLIISLGRLIFYNINMNAIILLVLMISSLQSFAIENGFRLEGESIEHYVRRTRLPMNKTIVLANSCSILLTLIPAGKGTIGIRPPLEPAIPNISPTMTFIAGTIGLCFSIIMVCAFVTILWKSIIKRRFQCSLKQCIYLFIGVSITVLSIGTWSNSKTAWSKFYKNRILYEDQITRLKHGSNMNELPFSEVTVEHPFYMSTFEITQGEYESLCGITLHGYGNGGDFPVYHVSFEDAVAFCNRLSTICKDTVRLPTEIEWEYACRSGSDNQYYDGNVDQDLAMRGWYVNNSLSKTHPVGSNISNAWGLFDMHGNVWEWCSSCAAGDEGLGVIRGGSFLTSANGCSCSYRGHVANSVSRKDIGFRIVIPVNRVNEK